VKDKILTYGCAMNQADSETIHGILKEQGLEDTGVIVVNTCTVKSPTENKILKRLRKLEVEGARVVVAGCLPAARPSITDEFPGFSFIGVNSEAITDAVSMAAVGERYVNIKDTKGKINLPQIESNPVVGIIPLCEGCLGSCNYCNTKNARGGLKSYKTRQIVDKAKGFVDNGAKELWITAQDTGAYGKDIGSSLPEIIDEICQINGEYRIRVGMMNPNHVMRMLDELVEAYSNEKVYKFAHIPVQSGSDKILKDMGRDYTVKDYTRIVERMRKEHDTTISTDVITGYPTETKEEFEETVKLIEITKPDVLNISRYWPRPGTPASQLKQLPGSETKKRSRIMNKVFKKVGLEQNNKWMGWKGKCIISKQNEDRTYTARNDWYRPIVLSSGSLGEEVEVKIDEVTHYDLRGSIV